MARITVKWRRVVDSEELRRSSQTIGIANERLHIFGGELTPREPVDNKVYTVDLQQSNGKTSTSSIPASSSSPPPRVGAQSATLNQTTYIFSGRGGPSMSPLDESGSLWSLSPSSSQWSIISPSPISHDHPPPPRSYGAMTSDSRSALYLHAGCPSSGRLNDLWAFLLSNKKWIRLSDAPGSPRGGTSIAFCGSEDVLFRHGGFDGTKEVGGSVDVYHPVNNSWTSSAYEADGVSGPEARSVAFLACVNLVAGGEEEKSFLLTGFGERDPSSLGHQGAGKMLDDMWAWDIKEEKWSVVEVDGGAAPCARGWFAAEALGKDELVLQGGLAEDNTRLGDVWVGKLSMST